MIHGCYLSSGYISNENLLPSVLVKQCDGVKCLIIHCGKEWTNQRRYTKDEVLSDRVIYDKPILSTPIRRVNYFNSDNEDFEDDFNEDEELKTILQSAIG